MVDDFIKRKRDPSKVVYDPPELEPILKETYGVIVYQGFDEGGSGTWYNERGRFKVLAPT